MLSRLFLVLAVMIVMTNTCLSQTDELTAPPRRRPLHDKLFLLGYSSSSLIHADELEAPRPLMWEASHNAEEGFVIGFERPFGGRWRHRNFVWGANIDTLKSGDDYEESFSLYGGLRWSFKLTRNIHPCITWSGGGLTYISDRYFNESRLSKRFVFQNFLRLGFNVMGRNPFFIGATFYHYSNADLFEHNKGYDVPWTITVGIPFD